MNGDEGTSSDRGLAGEPASAGAAAGGAALPGSVVRRLVQGAPGLAWLRLRDGRVVAVGGALSAQGLARVRIGEPIPDELPWKSLLDDELPTQVYAVPRHERSSAGLSDVHAWDEEGDVHILLLDANATFSVLGAQMQVGNEGEFLREQLAGSERLRRVERRSHGEALAALGYELLEQGPDGLFRPAAEPARWLVELCGWGADHERTLDADDPSDFLSCFLAEAREFLEGAPNVGPAQLRTLPSGVWTQALTDELGRTQETSFEAYALALTSGRVLIAVERLDISLTQQQQSLQKQRDAQLSYEGLAREMQVKEVLLHCIVHDLRGPLANLVGSLSLLETGDLSASEQREMIEIGLRQARRQDEMIRHVLDVFGAEYEALNQFDESARTAPDVVDVVRDSSERQRAAFQARGIELVVRAPEATLPVVGVADRLERVLTNLVSNALRHAPDGTAVEVEVSEPGDGSVEVAVLDRGPGVPGHLRERLFHRFVQGGSGGAAGLGLYYVRITVERWGGRVRYEPRPGGGAAFRVSLRRASD